MTYATGPGRGYRPLRGEPNDLVPDAERAEMYRVGLEEVRALIGAKTPAQPDTTCSRHVDHPGGSTPAGDEYCPECRRANRRKGD